MVFLIGEVIVEIGVEIVFLFFREIMLDGNLIIFIVRKKLKLFRCYFELLIFKSFWRLVYGKKIVFYVILEIYIRL